MNNLKHVIHLENDVLLYTNMSIILRKRLITMILIMIIPGIIYVQNLIYLQN